MTSSKLKFVNIDRHFRPPGLRLTLELDGATEQDIERGITAANRVFLLAELSSYAAASAVHYQELEDPPDLVLTSEQHEWAGIWWDAEEAAIAAACSEMPAGEKTYLFTQTWDDAPKPISGHYIRGTTWLGKETQE